MSNVSQQFGPGYPAPTEFSNCAGKTGRGAIVQQCDISIPSENVELTFGDNVLDTFIKQLNFHYRPLKTGHDLTIRVWNFCNQFGADLNAGAYADIRLHPGGPVPRRAPDLRGLRK